MNNYEALITFIFPDLLRTIIDNEKLDLLPEVFSDEKVIAAISNAYSDSKTISGEEIARMMTNADVFRENHKNDNIGKEIVKALLEVAYSKDLISDSQFSDLSKKNGSYHN